MSTWQSRRTLGALAVPAVLSLLSALPGLTPAASARPLTGAGTVTDGNVRRGRCRSSHARDARAMSCVHPARSRCRSELNA